MGAEKMDQLLAGNPEKQKVAQAKIKRMHEGSGETEEQRMRRVHEGRLRGLSPAEQKAYLDSLKEGATSIEHLKKEGK